MCHFIHYFIKLKPNSSSRYYSGLLLGLFLSVNQSVAFALTINQAENLAIQSDPIVEKFKAASQSYIEKSKADVILPDPKIKFGVANLPVDTFAFGQEPMTQVKLGYQQNFPRGDSLSIKQKQSRFLSGMELAKADATLFMIKRDVRTNFLNLYYEISAYKIVQETRKLFSELVKITESNYASGRANQQDVVLAGLELSRLDDRATKILASEEIYRAELSQWLGDVAWGAIAIKFPALPVVPDLIDLNKAITQHPLIHAENANIDASKQMRALSHQNYKPSWSLSLDYGARSGVNTDGSERPDFASALVSMDVPLFTSGKHDKHVAASERKIAVARYTKDDVLRSLKKHYEKNTRLWKRLSEREQLYKSRLLTAVKNNSEVALNAYQSGVSKFNTLLRAKITELDVRLEDLRIRVDREISQAEILYVTGDKTDEM